MPSITIAGRSLARLSARLDELRAARAAGVLLWREADELAALELLTRARI